MTPTAASLSRGALFGAAAGALVSGALTGCWMPGYVLAAMAFGCAVVAGGWDQ